MPAYELLAPAKDLQTGIAAINSGADAVYIGASKFGAREAAGNPLEDVETLIAYAHKYWAKVYVVVNTLLYDHEIEDAVRLISHIYQSGADALIIQDTGLLECDLPPIPLFASTQMHNDTPEKVAFLEKVGFQRAILARELSLDQISAIRAASTLELETFIHGALCVCYSGQCNLSYAIGGRSGNRGQCAQPCRRRYSLLDASGQTLLKDRHLLSIRDLNQTAHLPALIEAGVTSFKIEGRLKDKSYVMNVVGHYRRALDSIGGEIGGKKSSSGEVFLDFDPDPGKTFNRGFTSYFLLGRGDHVDSNTTPKMVGEPVGKVLAVGRNSFTLSGDVPLHNGDGISFFGQDGILMGTVLNRAEDMSLRRADAPAPKQSTPDSRLPRSQSALTRGDMTQEVFPYKMDGISVGLQVHRNHDHVFISQVDKSKSNRKISVKLNLIEVENGLQLEIADEDNIKACFCLDCPKIGAEKPELAKENFQKQLTKLGETEFTCEELKVSLTRMYFVPVSGLNELRRGAVEALRVERLARRPVRSADILPNAVPYPQKELTYLGNVLNGKAVSFYRRHGVERIEPAAESGLDMRGRKVMTTKYCIKYQLGHCPREVGDFRSLQDFGNLNEPLFLIDEENRRLRLQFDCKACVMNVIYE